MLLDGFPLSAGLARDIVPVPESCTLRKLPLLLPKDHRLRRPNYGKTPHPASTSANQYGSWRYEDAASSQTSR